MSIEIKTATVEPIRQTFSHTRRRFGDKPASRYQEASFDIEAAANFHYRPLWQPDKLLNDPTRTAVHMADWYTVSDPRQYYYGAYVQARARMQENAEHDFAFCERRELLAQVPAQKRALIARLLLPLRHAELGANMNNSGIAADAFGTSVTQMHMFQAMDRLAIAQYLSRIGLLLEDDGLALLAEAKQRWLHDTAWQGVRRYVEDTLVVRDWFELSLAQNLVSDGLLYPLLFERFDAQLVAEGAGQVGMLTEFMRLWFSESQRWVDALVKTVAAESEHNRQLIDGWLTQWRARALEALAPLAEVGPGREALDAIDNAFSARLKKLGLSGAAP
ncbi:aromatic/alkene monooxygenase hydroxylase subunit beta [Pseudomonas sp. ZM23]|uniref:Aromatic/alkene monooxygenase hydroxylase subunit beta n=1 Tax=Pseudomonas triclosanedens TaxID=2961893 RepID=A0ABY6ZSK6_9PSED|nr:aromatic/alkene monooxygenase hydroxylase subunit beta [Pseudomonas triclosanedens]MCP8467486.1 aromatic/alkene monooxygenase hydroxylase subunit beta [Pseudomonas triclosanedens]MCP8471663.1 aromatic/alkene monooxygenase hydroxylase subunit beta [Pseudomonas triclosanedens]MCP8478984.1 aromatic/alkene monooxygenase hydroxylase subunit beta [Pseudomonas triclosanedens]WAI47050.1 aromatic/alkene monooxygenase hydroxylase subunit beta [Pseudomonas triclosanedens]